MAENIPTRRRLAPLADAGPQDPPEHLSSEAADLWREIVAGWHLDAAGLAILRGALESWDTYQRCRRQVEEDGPTFRTESGMIRQHPAVKIGLDHFAAFRMALRQLGLEPAEPDREPIFA